MRFFLAVVILVLNGCHLIFPYNVEPAPDSAVEGGVDAGMDGVSTLDMSTDGWVTDSPKPKPDGKKADDSQPDSMQPDSLVPDSLPPDSMVPDSMVPDTTDPCTGYCLNGGTCTLTDGGMPQCSCKPGYDPTTQCGSCLPTHCGYTTGVCQLLPAITTTNPTLVCGGTGCQTNHVYEVPFSADNADQLTVELSDKENLITGNFGEYSATSSAGPFTKLLTTPTTPPISLTTTTKLWYKLAATVLSTNPQPYAELKLTAFVKGKPSCTPATVTINVPYK